MTIIRKEMAHALNGVAGRLGTLHKPPAPWKPGCFASQTWDSTRRWNTRYGKETGVDVHMRFDDNCRNGHNTFAITGETTDGSFGCIHDTIAKVFPELKHLIKWHGCTTDGPLYYVANTVYHATNLENGIAEGEPNAWEKGFRFGNSPVIWRPGYRHHKLINFLEARRGTELKVVLVAHGKDKPGDYDFSPKYTFEGYGDKWSDCPFDTLAEACEIAEAFKGEAHLMTTVTGYSKGKKRELHHARSCAVWPEATDEQLCLPEAELTKLLEARLPDLMARFRADIEAAGFMWECPA